MPSVPVLATQRQKIAWGALAAIVCAVLYALPSRLAGGRAMLLGMTEWERGIPYMPLTVWLYLAQFPLLVAAYLGCDSLIRCTRFLYAVVVVQALAAVVFAIMPLRYPRELHVASIATDPVTRALADWVRGIDPPVNCFPSLHVTSCMLTMLLVGVERTPRALAYGTVALASIASTLTFKQHYAIDLPAGALLAAAGWWAAGRLLAAGPTGIGVQR
jgi:hypothetical protein